MIESSGFLHRLGESIFSGMAEWRVADIVRQAQSFGQILVQLERTRQCPADLRDLDAVRQPNPEMISIRCNEDLRLVAQAAKGNRMDDAIAITLKGVARPAAFTRTSPMQTAARTRWIGGISCAHRAGSFSIT
jgi:hypothetical protein